MRLPAASAPAPPAPAPAARGARGVCGASSLPLHQAQMAAITTSCATAPFTPNRYAKGMIVAICATAIATLSPAIARTA